MEEVDEDSDPELDEDVVDDSSSTVDAEEDLEDSDPELDEAVVCIGDVELDESLTLLTVSELFCVLMTTDSNPWTIPL